MGNFEITDNFYQLWKNGHNSIVYDREIVLSIG